MAANTKNTNRKKSNPGIKEFRGKVTSLVDRGYQYIGMARVSEIPSVSSSEMMKGGGAIGVKPGAGQQCRDTRSGLHSMGTWQHAAEYHIQAGRQSAVHGNRHQIYY